MFNIFKKKELPKDEVRTIQPNIKCLICNIRNSITDEEIELNQYICPVCGTTYDIELRKGGDIGRRIIKTNQEMIKTAMHIKGDK